MTVTVTVTVTATATDRHAAGNIATSPPVLLVDVPVTNSPSDDIDDTVRYRKAAAPRGYATGRPRRTCEAGTRNPDQRFRTVPTPHVCEPAHPRRMTMTPAHRNALFVGERHPGDNAGPSEEGACCRANRPRK